ncbi:MAG TPA: hypothetical protein VKA21_10175 [Candidatus Binatia bacterium]|nr:hypothetical protein [Candidatus Binatia bacterium]
MVPGRGVVMGNERVRQAVAYVERSDLRPLETMGLSAADLDELLAIVGDSPPPHLRRALEDLYLSRARAEADAGLGIPIVVVAPETGPWRKAVIAGAIGLVLVGVAIALVVGTHVPAPAVPQETTAPAAAPGRPGAKQRAPRRPSRSRRLTLPPGETASSRPLHAGGARCSEEAVSAGRCATK